MPRRSKSRRSRSRRSKSRRARPGGARDRKLYRGRRRGDIWHNNPFVEHKHKTYDPTGTLSTEEKKQIKEGTYLKPPKPQQPSENTKIQLAKAAELKNNRETKIHKLEAEIQQLEQEQNVLSFLVGDDGRAERLAQLQADLAKLEAPLRSM